MTGREEHAGTGDPTPRWQYRFQNFSRACSLLREFEAVADSVHRRYLHLFRALRKRLEDLDVPQKCDAQAFEEIRHAPLKRHIEAVGVTIYTRLPAADN